MYRVISINLFAAMAVLLSTIVLLAVPVLAAPTSLAVNTTLDGNDATPGDGVCETASGNALCSLRAAVQEANATGSVSTISVLSGTYLLTLGQINISRGGAGSSLTIQKVGGGTVVVDGNQADRVFWITGSTVTIKGMTIQRGMGALGGGINSSGMVTLDTVVVTDNSGRAGYAGGGVSNSAPGVMTIRNSIISNNTTPDNSGGGVLNVNGTMVIEDSQVVNNRSYRGGGGVLSVNSTGTASLTIARSVIDGNQTLVFPGDNPASAAGGGIIGSGMVTLTDVVVTNNTAGTSGGGLVIGRGSYGLPASANLTNVVVNGNQAGTNGGGLRISDLASLTNVTVSNNTAGQHGGGISLGGTAAAAADVSLTNVTISGNTANPASGRGGGIHLENSSPTPAATLLHVTIANNSTATGGGIAVASGSAQVRNTLIAAGLIGANCDGSLTSNGGNLSSDASCAVSLTQSSDQNGVNPLLGPLADNGGPPIGVPTGPNYGPAKTHALLVGSPAIDKAISCPPPATDQRGTARPLEGDAISPAACDIGAFEAPAVALDTIVPVTSVTTTPSAPDGQNGWFVTNVTVALSAADPAPATGVKEIVYSASGAQPIPSTTATGSAATFVIGTEGTTTISFAARDNTGNVEPTKTLTIKLDKTAPAPPTVTNPAAKVSVQGATSYAVQGTAEAGSLVRAWVDANQNGQRDPGEAQACPPPGCQQQLASGAAAFSIDVPLVPGFNSFVVTATDPAGHESLATLVPTINSTGAPNAPDLSLSMKAQGLFRSGQQGTYLLTVANKGKVETTQPISVTDTLPSGLAFQGGFDPNGAPLTCQQVGTTTAYRCDLAGVTLAPNKTYQISITVTVTASGGTQLTNTAQVSTVGDTNPANDTATDTITVQQPKK